MALIKLTSENFDEVTAKGTVLVDFYADWCGPCRMVGPIVEEIANENATDAVIAKLNVDDEGEIASRFGVMSIPTLIVLKDGEEATRAVGVRSKEQILAML